MHFNQYGHVHILIKQIEGDCDVYYAIIRYSAELFLNARMRIAQNSYRENA